MKEYKNKLQKENMNKVTHSTRLIATSVKLQQTNLGFGSNPLTKKRPSGRWTVVCHNRPYKQNMSKCIFQGGLSFRGFISRKRD